MKGYFDCHCDTIWRALNENTNLRKNNLHIDFERMDSFDFAFQVFASWVCADERDLQSPFECAMRHFDFFEGEVERNNALISFVNNKADFQRIIDDKKSGAILMLEGGEAFEGSEEKCEILFDRGVKIATLTWNYKNEIGAGALSGCDDGLSDFGKAIIRKMNRLGMLIDVSHLNEKGFWDVFRLSEKPFCATHSNAYALCPHPRNLTDKQLLAIREAGGFVGVNLYSNFLTEKGGATVDDVIRHIDYMAEILGEERLCLGGDLDGMDAMPQGMKDISDYRGLIEKIAFYLGKDFAEKIAYKNMVNGFFLE